MVTEFSQQSNVFFATLHRLFDGRDIRNTTSFSLKYVLEGKKRVEVEIYRRGCNKKGGGRGGGGGGKIS